MTFASASQLEAFSVIVKYLQTAPSHVSRCELLSTVPAQMPQKMSGDAAAAEKWRSVAQYAHARSTPGLVTSQLLELGTLCATLSVSQVQNTSAVAESYPCLGCDVDCTLPLSECPHLSPHSTAHTAPPDRGFPPREPSSLYLSPCRSRTIHLGPFT